MLLVIVSTNFSLDPDLLIYISIQLIHAHTHIHTYDLSVNFFL